MKKKEKSLRKSLLTLLVILSSSIISSCAQPPDVIMCASVKPGELGWCTMTISEKEFYVDNEKNGMHEDGEPCKLSPPKSNLVVDKDCRKWEYIEKVSLKAPPHSYAKIKAFIMKICKQHNECANGIGSWDRKFSKMDGFVGSK